MSLQLDVISLLSLLAAVNLLYVVAFAFLEGLGLLSARFFAALGLAGAWWAGCLGLAFTDLGPRYPALLQASQLLSGHFGPLILLFTLSYLGVIDRWRWRWAPLLMPGFAGTASFIGLLAARPPHYDAVTREFLAHASAFDIARIGQGAAWYPLLQRIHGTEVIVCTLLSVGAVLAYAARGTNPVVRREARVLSTIYLTLIVGVALTVVLPPLGRLAWAARLAPLVPLPFMLVLLGFLRRRMATAERLTKEREVLVSYLPTQAVDHVLHDASVTQTGRKAEAVVLFCDLRGFTTLSEQVDATALVAWIDEFFQRMTQVILGHGGMVDKLIGDAVLAVFGVPTPIDDGCGRAVRAARRMQLTLDELNAERPLIPGTAVRMGIGLHVGELVAGSVGGRARRTYTVFGDTVNVASRVEALTKELSAAILITGDVQARLDAASRLGFVAAGSFTLRGRREPVALYAVPASTP